MAEVVCTLRPDIEEQGVRFLIPVDLLGIGVSIVYKFEVKKKGEEKQSQKSIFYRFPTKIESEFKSSRLASKELVIQ